MIIRTIKWAIAHKDRMASLALVFGFIMDVITFRNINLSLSQIILAVHLCIVAVAILLYALPIKKGSEESFFSKMREWIPIVHQYSTGALLSAFLVLYTASGSLVSSAPFIVLLVIAIAGNELLHLKKYRLPFQTTIFFLNLVLFAALAVPIALGSITVATFITSMVASIIVFLLFISLVRMVAGDNFKKTQTLIRAGSTTVMVVLAVLYFNNLIPPIPLAVKSADFYHYVERQGNSYFVIDEQRDLLERFFALSGVTLHITEGEKIYFYSAVFAPTTLDTSIVHRWERYDFAKEKWVTHNVVDFAIQGGRKKGYRAFSFVENPSLGRWRVSVETKRGQIIGRTYLFLEGVVEKRIPTERILE